MNNIKTFIEKFKILGEKRNLPRVILALVAIVVISFMLFRGGQREELAAPVASSQTNGNQPADIIFYYGQEDVHSKNIQKFIMDNDISEKISFDTKEVWHNESNKAEFDRKGQECALEQNKYGVPFVYARSKCYIGETEVKDFLKKEAAIQ